MNRLLPLLTFVLLLGCGLVPPVSLGGKEGIPPIKVNTVVELPNFNCGDPIQNDEYTITTAKGSEMPPTTCILTFKKTVPVLKSDDYSSRPELAPLKTATAASVSAISVNVTKFDVTDAVAMMPLNRETYVQSVDAKAFGETIFTKADLTKSPPYTKTISGAAIAGLQAQVKSNQPISIPVDVTLVVPLTPKPPAKIGIVFEGQPSITISFGS